MQNPLAPKLGAAYTFDVRIISRSTLSAFVRNRVEPRLQRVVQEKLDAWFALASRAEWRNSAELKLQNRSASIISAERVVFNIKGNDFRLITAIDYEHQILLIIWLGTHREYDRVDPATVIFDKERYAHPSHSN
jgi:mRNA interferase HigB